MNKNFKKYAAFPAVNMTMREWPSRTITAPPTWCSVDLRDGNQALVNPMSLSEKLIFFRSLIDIGFKEIEVGFPSASQTEYDTVRTLIERDMIPDDVTIQVLTQSRGHLIRKTFESVRGAKNVIVHFYNSTSTLQRKVVFQKDMQGIIDVALEGARLIRELMAEEQERSPEANFIIEYSPESFTGTEIDFAVEICERVVETIGATPENKMIINLPATVELSMPNQYADQIEYFLKHITCRDSIILSIHPHNDRGTGVAATELAILAGAERVEGTLFGNGERTGNADIITIAMNMFTQGIDPKLKFDDIVSLREICESITGIDVNPRHPYAGELVFTAFSGSHQDAINKGVRYMKEHGSDMWEVPYLPIDPADVGRQYEPIIRINSQSGKGGAAFVMENNFGFILPKSMHPEFGAIVQEQTDAQGSEMPPEQVMELFRSEYIDVDPTYTLLRHRFDEWTDAKGASTVIFDGVLGYCGTHIPVRGEGNGPIDSFFNAISDMKINGFQFVSYSEHAVSQGSDSKAAAYIHLKTPDGKDCFGVGMSNNINLASIRGILSAINRAIIKKEGNAVKEEKVSV